MPTYYILFTQMNKRSVPIRIILNKRSRFESLWILCTKLSLLENVLSPPNINFSDMNLNFKFHTSFKQQMENQKRK